MQISEKQVENVAKLARLAVSPDEIKRFAEQLSGILTYVEKLNELNTEGIEPTSHPLPLFNIFREDQVAVSLPMDAVLGNAPEKDEPFFRVPKIIESPL
ncbi:MAG: Asp-tRNA(Asn)/Glu-tRNA(Gln) amidotransferase subunit GatC [Nitrospirota bacterium]